jgi:hypothetical protein
MKNVEKEKQYFLSTMKKSKHLLQCAQGIFGEGMIVDAWVNTYWSPGNETLSERDKRLEYNESQIIRNKTNRFLCPDQKIYLKFNNGRVVYFTNAEAGEIGFLYPNLCPNICGE